MHLWVIYIGHHLSLTLKYSHAPAENRTGDPSIYSLALYHVAIKAGLYCKAVQVFYIPNLYPVTYQNDIIKYLTMEMYDVEKRAGVHQVTSVTRKTLHLSKLK